MPDQIIRLPGVSDQDWNVLQNIWPVYVCEDGDYDPEEFSFLIAAGEGGFSLIVEKGGKLDEVIQRYPVGFTAKRRKAQQDFKTAGAHYLNSYRAWVDAERARLQKAAQQQKDDADWFDLGHPRG